MLSLRQCTLPAKYIYLLKTGRVSDCYQCQIFTFSNLSVPLFDTIPIHIFDDFHPVCHT